MKIISRVKKLKKKHLITLSKSLFWFFIGVGLGLFLLVSFALIIFQKTYSKDVYPGISINDVNLGGKTEKEIQEYFNQKNSIIGQTTFTFNSDNELATISAKALSLGYNGDLLAEQAYSIGRSNDLFSNFTLIFQAYLYGISLPPSYRYSDEALSKVLQPIVEEKRIEPIEALFTFENNRVTAFRPSSNGQEVDVEEIKKTVISQIPLIATNQAPANITINVPIREVMPKITTEKANNLGIQELIGTGTSIFPHSIPSRIFNITLAASRVNGILIAPGETFSFNKALGDVSSFTGFQQAYVIQNGRTVLGDGGGVCQVSTTFFRALLNAGLPIVERHAHAYRVGYYEEDSPPGFDATIYTPTVDLKFKNDTGNYILIQSILDSTNLRLTYNLYGKKDGRVTVISKPIVTNQTPAPPPLYQDDPTLPKGVTKQVDFAAAGARATFTRQVTKDGEVILDDTFVSNYRPWQAVYLRGTL